jgi:hypothetical protein
MKLNKTKALISLLVGLASAGIGKPALAQSSNSTGESILPLTLLNIESIQLEGTNVIVKVDVSANIKAVFLETRPRLGSGSWEPRAVQRPSDSSTQVKMLTFRLPLTANMELLRVRGDTSEVLPASFFSGTNSSVLAISGLGDASGINSAEYGDKVALPGTAGPAPTATTAPPTTRAVVESDIWNVDGDTLYFFNQYRGLQIVDIAKPDAPVLRATYALPAAGEQMYVLNSGQVVLLAHDYCGNGSSGPESQVILLDATAGQPRLVGALPVTGTIRESRVVGSALYVIAERYRPIPASANAGNVKEVWEWGSEISSFDLSQFSKPVVKFTGWVPGYGNAIMATDRYLFVATPQANATSWSGNSDVRVYDISAPDGTTHALSTVPARGRVKDKFKMNLNGDVLTLVTEPSAGTLKPQVETYSLANPKSPVALGVLPIVEREQLYATRFDGNLLYAVTFFRVDPLWIIDLSNPAQPRKVGELEIPGYSTYLHPLGDRLLAIGLDNTSGWRVAVQLFDVSNPAKPGLLSKVLLGEQYSSSEANQDEKAFGVLPDQNLLLVPYSTWTTNGSFQGVHLIDLDRNSLRKRGAIDHDLQARRATVHRGRILSLSGEELLSVDATDRDRPKVIAKTELSWSVDRVFLQGEHLIELTSQWGNEPSLRVVLANQTDRVLKQLSLTNLPFLGATVRDQRLYVAQGKSTEVIWPQTYNPTNYFPVATNQAKLTLSIFDLTKLPELPLLGQSQTPMENRYWNNLDAVWPKPGVLVWSSQSSWGWPWYRGGPIAITDAIGTAPPPAAGLAVDSRIAYYPIWRGSDSQLLAYDVADSTAPKFVSEVNLRGTNSWWNFSSALAANGLVYLSHQASEYMKDLTPPPYQTYRSDGSKTVITTNYPPPGTWVQRYYLDVVNFNDPKSPVVRKPAALAGSLIGVSHQGALLYTQGSRYGDLTNWTSWAEWIDASAYDGLEPRVVHSLPLPQGGSHPVAVQDANLYLGRPADSTNSKASLEVWTLPDSGKFTRLATTSLDFPAYNLKVFGDTLAAQLNSEVQWFGIANPQALPLLGRGGPDSCIGYNLNFADGAAARGLWIPLGAYGVITIEPKR